MVAIILVLLSSILINSTITCTLIQISQFYEDNLLLSIYCNQSIDVYIQLSCAYIIRFSSLTSLALENFTEGVFEENFSKGTVSPHVIGLVSI